MEENIVIRPMEIGDLEAVCLLEASIFSSPWKYNDFLTSIEDNNNIYLVVELGQEIVAYCGLWGVAGEGQINNVAVKEEYRKKHIGYEMLNKLLEYGQSIELKEFTLEVRSSNTGAITLYHKLGFKDAGIRKDFYSKPKEDAIIMWK